MDKKRKKKNLKDNNYNNTRDFIIKLILLIIIIILLLHNCGLMRLYEDSRKNNQVPTGNMDIFEIECSKNGCNKSIENPKTDGKTNESDNVIRKKSGSNTRTAYSTYQDTNEDTSSDENGSVEVIDDMITWKSTNHLRIFTNPVFNMDKIIEPDSSNAYQFIIKNNTNYNISYNIDFVETNDYNINMKFKLKRDGNYIAGNENEWVSYEELANTNILLDSSKSHSYYLDWKWVSSDHDTEAGANSAQYKLDILIKAVQNNG